MATFGGGVNAAMQHRVMIFVDGAYLRTEFDKARHNLEINFNQLKVILLAGVSNPELIRIYYYDAFEDDINVNESILPNNEALNNWEEFKKRIKNTNGYEIREGRVKKSGKKKKQKGVDVLLAIDMITKAYENQYDMAILLTGDDDFLDVVKAVKDTGKRVYGAYVKNSTSQDLIDAFDSRQILSNEHFDRIEIKKSLN